jgi:Flp pilus assembly pilin Flp
MNNISHHFLKVQPVKIVVEYTAITALIAAFCVSAVKYGVVEALIAIFCVSILTEVSAGLNAKFNSASNTHTGYRCCSLE